MGGLPSWVIREARKDVPKILGNIWDVSFLGGNSGAYRH